MASPAGPVRAGAGMRLLRTAVFAAVCVVLAAAAHAIASGLTIPSRSLVLGWLAVVAIVAPLAGRERTLPGIAGLLVAGQIVLHAVFNVGQMCASFTQAAASGVDAGAVVRAAGPGGGPLAATAKLACGGHSGHSGHLTEHAAWHLATAAGLHVPAPGQGVSGAEAALRLADIGLICTLPMAIGHLLAALAAGWLLHRGEAALWRLLRGVSTLATAVRRAVAAVAALGEPLGYARPRTARAPRAIPARPRTVLLRHSLDRRGPPCLVTAA